MVETDYSLTKLWPEFSRLLVGDVTSPEGMSAAFVAFLLATVAFYSIWSLIKYFLAWKHLRFYKNLLKGLTAEQLMERRRELINSALENATYGRLWREFDESLVHIPQKQRLCNTLDAAHFFNTHTIARGLTENRLLAAVPGFLTAIGVIGTFTGLQLGLGPLGDLDPANAKVEDLTHGIFGMIGGASIAFLTSVWGVFTSVVFNGFEKYLERNIRSSISSFQNQVDYLYPRITAEQSLSNIEDFTRQSNDRLAELDEKIGHKMQEAMQEASGVISESLNTILGPAIERLVDHAHSGSEKAFKSLLERFLQGVGSAGDAQKAIMEQAANEIAMASGGLTEGLQGFASKLEDQVNNMMDKNAEVLIQVNGEVSKQLETQNLRDVERHQQMTASVNEFMTSLKSQLASLAEQNAVTIKSVQGELSRQIEEQRGREIARQKILHDQLKGFQSTQERVTESIETVLSVQREQNVELLESLRLVIGRFEQLSTSHQNAATAMHSVSSEMKAGANQLGLLSANLKSAVDHFSEQLSDALDNANTITKNNAETAALFDRVVNDLGQAGDLINTASGSLNEAAAKAETGLAAVDRHFDSLGKSLQEHIAALEQKIADLLSDYAERVQSQTINRLNTWNEHTNNYISSMTDAVRTLSCVVDEIDGKTSTLKQGRMV